MIVGRGAGNGLWSTPHIYIHTYIHTSCTSGEKSLGPNILGAKCLSEMSCGLKTVGQMP
jgi:hypothetical protein